MIFPTACSTPRPVRLSEATRAFAWDSLHHKYGLEARKTPHVDMSGVAGYRQMNMLEKYDACIAEIAARAPVRIVPGERVSGSASLGDAISYQVPGWADGQCLCMGASHLTADFETVLRVGLRGIEQQVKICAAANTDPSRAPVYRSMQNALDALRVWHGRYLAALDPDSENHRNLSRVPYAPPRNFHEAVQSIWFVFAFLRLCGNWPGIGRLDVLLGPYLDADLAAGRLTLDEAREILAHFFIKGCEWICGDVVLNGDAMHYQNIVLSGVDEDGRDVTNAVTGLVLDIVEELGISDFPISVRVSPQTDPKLLRRLAQVIRHGGGIVAVYNEPLVIQALIRAGFDLRQARRFANDGCWEVQVPGRTFFTYLPFDGLSILQNVTLQGGNAHFESYSALYERFLADLHAHVGRLYEETRTHFEYLCAPDSSSGSKERPCTVISLFEEGCIRRGRCYFEGGPDYNIFSPHIGGITDIANSLYAVKKAVFEDHIVTFDRLMQAVSADWAGEEPLRQQILNGYSWWGNDNDEADQIAADILGQFADFCAQYDAGAPLRFIPGVSTFGRQIEWVSGRTATTFGKKKGAVLSGNFSPTPGTDARGATAVIRSCCKADLVRQTNGAALDIVLSPGSVRGEGGLAAIEGLIRGFTALGGFFMQMDVVDAAVLRAAQADPESYQTLSVRVSGWNARFVTLTREWQDMVIERDTK